MRLGQGWDKTKDGIKSRMRLSEELDLIKDCGFAL